MDAPARKTQRGNAVKRTLAWRVLIVLALAAIIPTVTVGALAIWRARTNLEREVVRGNLALIRELGASLDGRLQSARRSLELAAAAWADEKTADTARSTEMAATERLLRRLRREVPLFASIGIYDVDGEPIAGDQVAVETGVGAHTFGGYIGDIAFVDGKPRVRVVTQARSRTGELVGTFVAQLDVGFIAEALAQARLGTGARLLVVDGDGVPVARSDGVPGAEAKSLRGTNVAVDRALGSASEGNIETGDTVAVYRNLSTYQSLHGVRWAIILEQPERDAYALAYETTRNTIIGVIAALTLALLIGLALATRLIRPLEALAARTDVIAGEGDAKPLDEPIRGPGEIGVLAERLEEMARRLGEREQLKDALSRGDRLAAVGTMAASIAHEINNPLTTVLGYAKLLAEDKGEDHPDRAGLELISDEAQRMQEKVRELLDYSRAETVADEHTLDQHTDVNALVAKTEHLLGPSLQRQKVDMVLELTNPLPPAKADPHAVQQVFVNLANNAAQAMDDGGRLTITTQLGPGATAIHVRFEDTGPGVPTSDRVRIFDPFFTTKGAGVGTGLGLAVARHLMARSGGSLGIEDCPNGRGACFRVVLPIEEL